MKLRAGRQESSRSRKSVQVWEALASVLGTLYRTVSAIQSSERP